MHKEISKGKSNWFFAVLLTVTAGLGIIALLNFFDLENYRTLLELAILVLTVVSVYFILRFCICQFIYVIIDNKFVVHRITGKNDSIVFSVEFSDMKEIAKNSEADFSKYGKLKGSLNFGHKFGTKKMYGVVYKNKSGEYSKFSFEPSTQLLELFKEKIEDFRNK